MRKIINRWLTIKKYKWLIERYSQLASDERSVMLDLYRDGKRDAAKLSLKQAAHFEARAMAITEALEKV